MRPFTNIMCVLLLVSLAFGCGQRSSLSRKIIHGEITCGGEAVPKGIVRFVPIDNTQGPATSAIIVNGRYHADNRGGVPSGKHRVEIIAQRPTGKKIEISPGQFVDKFEEIGDRKYAGQNSPLVCEVNGAADEQMDFDIPK